MKHRDLGYSATTGCIPASPILLAVVGDAVELAVSVLGKALLLRHGLDALGMETVLGVVEVDVIGELPMLGLSEAMLSASLMAIH